MTSSPPTKNRAKPPTKHDMPLTDKVAVIIGATGQLGPATATAFAQHGAKLALVGTHKGSLEQLRMALGFRDTRVTTHVADALDEGSMLNLAAEVQARYGRVDILLHLVGKYLGGELQNTPDEIWDEMLNANLRTAVNAIRTFLPALTANGWGRILTISSGITQAPPGTAVAYVTAKAALETMTLAVAHEVKDKGVTANVVLIRALDPPTERAIQPNTKTGRVKPEDVAMTLLFLCSDEAGAIAGARIPVFGGS